MNSPNVKEDTDYFTPHYKDPLYVLDSSKKRDNYFVKQQWINNLKIIIVNKQISWFTYCIELKMIAFNQAAMKRLFS